MSVLNVTKRQRGDELYKAAASFLVGGVGAGSRYVPSMGRAIYMERADGPYLFDVDGNQYIDYHNSSAASFLGYNHPAIRAAIQRALELGFFLGYETRYHIELARTITEIVPSAERVRYSPSGTEATMGAIRLARAVTGKAKILRFEGHFHGMHDYVLYNQDYALGEILPHGEVAPAHESTGMPDTLDALVVISRFNDPDAFLSCMRRHRGEFAAIIMEPVNYNAGCLLPKREFVQLVREAATQDGAVLIFDEVLSGFRMGPGGGQEYLGILPDLTCLSKAVGSGMPLAVIAGKREIMEAATPTGGAVLSGTYTGHLVTVMGSLAALNEIRAPGFYDRIYAMADRLYSGMNAIFERHKIKAVVQGLGARFGIFFGMEPEDLPITDFRTVVQRFDRDMDQRFTRLVFERQMYFRDGGRRLTPMHHGFTAAHSLDVIDETLNRLDDACARL